MKIGIVGTGNVGAILGTRLGSLGHEIHFVTRSPQSELAQSLTTVPGVVSLTDRLATLIPAVPLCIYAGPYDSAREILGGVSDFQNTIVVDCTNPLNRSFDALQLGHTESAGEKIAAWAAGARVVKAFNTTSVATLANPTYGEHRATQFYCGDDAEAKQVVAKLIDELGMEPVDAGPLSNSRYLEATAMLYIHLAVRGGWGGNCALKMLRR